MIRNRKTIITVAIMLLVMMTICSCEVKDSSSDFSTENIESSNDSTDDYIYEFTNLGFNLLPNADYTCIGSDKDGMYGLKKINNEGHINYSFLRLRNEETKAEETLIDSGNIDFDRLVTGKDGSFYAVRTNFTDKTATHNNEKNTELSGVGNKKLVKYSSSGDEIWETVLVDNDSGGNSQNIAYLKNKGILMYSKSGFSFYDEDTGKGRMLNIEDQGNIHNDRSILSAQDGRVFICETDSKWKYILYEFDVRKMSLTNKIYAPQEVYSSGQLFTGISYDFYYVNNRNVYGFNYGDKELTIICNFIDSGFYVDNTLLFIETSQGNYRIIATYKVESGKVFSMSKKDRKSDEKTVITIGTAFTDEYIKKRIIEFNQNSDEYLIKVKEYSEGGYSSYYSVYKAMNDDIEAGNAPDIMVLNSYSSIDSYISKGFLEPLDNYLENDKEIQEKKYLENLKALQKRNGKNYMIIPFFSVNTCAASKEHLDGVTVSLQNYINLCNKHNVKIQYMLGNVYFEGIDELYTTSGFDFIDFENNTCNFKNYKFINLLIYLREIKRLGDSKGPRIDSDCYKNDKAFLLPYLLTSFEDYKIIKDGYFETEISFNGYPSKEGGSSYINPGMMFAISSSSNNKKAAWEFIRYFLLDEYQYGIDWGFPVNEKAFDSMMEASCEEKYYIDENGKKIITKSKTIIGDKEISINPLTSQEAHELKEFICSIDKLRHQDTELIGIISESAKPYFNGEITAEKASNLIQHRVEKYLKNE